MHWKRNRHWKRIRTLVHNGGVYAYIERGRRPNEYTIVFTMDKHDVLVRGRWHEIKKPPDYVLVDSTLATAKAVGLLIAKAEVP
jgi:hypothetical protein